jgi:hypothetical protein
MGSGSDAIRGDVELLAEDSQTLSIVVGTLILPLYGVDVFSKQPVLRICKPG